MFSTADEIVSLEVAISNAVKKGLSEGIVETR